MNEFDFVALILKQLFSGEVLLYLKASPEWIEKIPEDRRILKHEKYIEFLFSFTEDYDWSAVGAPSRWNEERVAAFARDFAKRNGATIRFERGEGAHTKSAINDWLAGRSVRAEASL
jgi:urate oxidase